MSKPRAESTSTMHCRLDLRFRTERLRASYDRRSVVVKPRGCSTSRVLLNAAAADLDDLHIDDVSSAWSNNSNALALRSTIATDSIATHGSSYARKSHTMRSWQSLATALWRFISTRVGKCAERIFTAVTLCLRQSETSHQFAGRTWAIENADIVRKKLVTEARNLIASVN